ncbi:6790_t:CDS:1 [Dentiscutata erythropus]|uniref:6790_t:CDS:1 n=1 Tax=Dentiscutata erythropus TaxID=1348616 RepID=A0A9N9JXH9_9GLOM|nr:6790_t:CDS:1 [Dentiscutata erythropus]
MELTHLLINQKGLLRINDKINKNPAQILNDSGATRNFIDKKFAKQNNLFISTGKKIYIELVNGAKEKSHKLITLSKLELGTYYTFGVEVHLISLCRNDLILGQS